MIKSIKKVVKGVAITGGVSMALILAWGWHITSDDSEAEKVTQEVQKATTEEYLSEYSDVSAACKVAGFEPETKEHDECVKRNMTKEMK